MKEESFPSHLAWEQVPGNLEHVVVFSHVHFWLLTLTSWLHPVGPQFSLCEMKVVIAPTSLDGCEYLAGLLEAPPGTNCSCLLGWPWPSSEEKGTTAASLACPGPDLENVGFWALRL